MTIHRGRRWSTARAYLRPVLGRPNLFVFTGCLATRVLLERGRAVGVEYAQHGARQAGPGHARGDPGRRRDQLAAIADAVGDRPGRRAGGRRGRGRARPARGRAESAGPSGVLLPGREPGAGDAARSDAAAQHGQDRAALVPVPRWAGSLARSSRPAASSAPGRACATRTSSSISCRRWSRTTVARKAGCTPSRAMSGRCGRRAPVGCGCARPTRASIR